MYIYTYKYIYIYANIYIYIYNEIRSIRSVRPSIRPELFSELAL